MTVKSLLAAWAFSLLAVCGLTGSATAQTGGPAPAPPAAAVPQRVGPLTNEIAFTPKEAARQVELFQSALAGLAPQRPGVADVYVLSMSLWDDHVFQQEASETARVLSSRFNGAGRTLVLSAGVKGETRTLPAATPLFIQAAIGKIGAVMNPEEDALVLFITSHGNRDGSAAFFEQQRLQGSLAGRQLRAALDDAGIKHRLVIVSACFSGAFIRPLASDTSIILTAASSTQTSFGCQPERDWTYFGDAFVNQALRSGLPLLPAFEKAKTTISEWETRDKFEPSNPQRFVGPQTGPLLAALGTR